MNEIWDQVVTDLELSISRPYFESYVKRLRLVEWEDGEGKARMVLACQSVFHQSEIEKRLLANIEDKAQEVAGKMVAVKLVVDAHVTEKVNGDDSPLFATIDEKRVDGRVDKLIKSGLKKELNLESFAVSSSNEMAYAAARAVANNPGKAYNPLFLYGGVGVGKTHLMQGVGQAILEKESGMELIYCSGEEFTNEIIDAIRKKSTSAFRKRYRNVELLLIDDIQFIAGKAAVQEEFFHTFNAIVRVGGQILLTSDKPPKEIDSLEERLRSRFEGGLAIDIGEPDFELRSAIIMIKAKQLKCELPPDVAQEIAQHQTNTRALLGMLMKVMAYAEARKKPLDVELAREVLGVEAERERRNLRSLEPARLIESVAAFYQASVDEVTGPRRVKTLTLPRHVAMYLMKMDLRMGYVEIGRCFGGRDHTSVMHAVGKVGMLIKNEGAMGQELEEIRRELYKGG